MQYNSESFSRSPCPCARASMTLLLEIYRNSASKWKTTPVVGGHGLQTRHRLRVCGWPSNKQGSFVVFYELTVWNSLPFAMRHKNLSVPYAAHHLYNARNYPCRKLPKIFNLGYLKFSANLTGGPGDNFEPLVASPLRDLDLWPPGLTTAPPRCMVGCVS